MSQDGMSKAEYLKQKYASGRSLSYGPDDTKRRKKRRKVEKHMNKGMVIHDEDQSWKESQQRVLKNTEEEFEPTIVDRIDDMPAVVNLGEMMTRANEEKDASPPRKRHYDEPIDLDQSPPRRRTTESRRRRDDEEKDASPPRKPRIRSDPSPARQREGKSVSSRRNEQDLDQSPPRRTVRVGARPRDNERRSRAYSREREKDSSPPRKRLSTEVAKKEDPERPRAGLKSGKQFGEELANIRKQESLSGKASDKDLGKGQETIFRDKRGRKLDMLIEMKRQQEIAEGTREREEREEYEWGTGKVQKQQKQTQIDEYQKIQNQPFSRYAHDSELEEQRKNKVRSFDPINSKIFTADEPLKKKSKTKSKIQTTSDKPKYKGPPAPTNRFGVLPGYRWDGVVRGTAWEEKYLKKQIESHANKEDAYRWATQDM